jgi:hypothetical protein
VFVVVVSFDLDSSFDDGLRCFVVEAVIFRFQLRAASRLVGSFF